MFIVFESGFPCLRKFSFLFLLCSSTLLSLSLFGFLFTSVTPSLSLSLTKSQLYFEPGTDLGNSSSRSGQERVKKGEDRRSSLPWTLAVSSRVPSLSPHRYRASLWKADVAGVGGDSSMKVGGLSPSLGGSGGRVTLP